ncbi:hypothetical protein [Nocardia sp. XZ_19_369]|uniref:hypothetical protein n=1 Tax=Nocardia sp. XZ_19_369 TaxID=2769487 RepID=UPI00188E0A01|nr:hypothetical protein [Nocardia sp. XZ_19_369]
MRDRGELTKTQLLVMRAMDDGRAHDIDDLAADLGRSSRVIARTMTWLQQEGYVQVARSWRLAPVAHRELASLDIESCTSAEVRR